MRSFGGSRSRPAVGGYSTWVARPFGKSASYARLVVRGTCLALTILAPLAVSLRTGRCFVAKCHVGFRLACPPHRERTLLHIFAPFATLRSGDRLHSIAFSPDVLPRRCSALLGAVPLISVSKAAVAALLVQRRWSKPHPVVPKRRSAAATTAGWSSCSQWCKRYHQPRRCIPSCVTVLGPALHNGHILIVAARPFLAPLALIAGAL